MEFLFNKVAALSACNFVKKKLQNRCFSVNIAKFLRTPFFLQNTSGGCFCNVQVIHFPKIHRSVLCKIIIDLLYFWDVYDVNLLKKENSAEVRHIHAEQISLYNFIVLRKNNRHSWRLNKSSKTFKINRNLWVFLNCNTVC